LAHSRSALKRWRQSLQRRNRNRSAKSRTRTLLNKALTGIDGEPTAAEEAVRAAVSALDRAAQKGIIHRNAAARSKSRILKRYNLAVAGQVAAAAASTPAGEAKAAETEPEAPRRGILGRRAAASSKKKPDAPPRARAPRARKETQPAEEKKPAPRTRTRKT
jgi:small subunit ribosomal protein S20